MITQLCFFLCVFLVNVKSSSTTETWNVGNGVVLKFDRTNKNAPFIDRLTMDVKLGDFSVSLRGAKSNSVELKVDVEDDQFEGRSKRKGDKNGMYSLMISFKTAMLTTIMVAALKLFTLKSLILAKMALMISIIALLSKMKHDHHKPEYIEIEERVPVHSYGYQDHHGHTDHETASSNLYNDVIYAPSVASQASSSLYSSPALNKTGLYPAHGLERRQGAVSDDSRKFPLASVVSIKKISPARR